MKRLYLILIFVLASVALIALYFYLLQLINQNNEKITELSLNFAEIEKNTGDFEMQRRLSKEIGPHMDNLKSRVVSSDGGLDFISKVEGVLETAGVSHTINSIKESENFTSANYNSVTFQVVIDGSFNDVVKAVDLISHLPMAIKINSTTLNLSGDYGVSKASGPKWQAAVEFSIIKEK